MKLFAIRIRRYHSTLLSYRSVTLNDINQLNSTFLTQSKTSNNKQARHVYTLSIQHHQRNVIISTQILKSLKCFIPSIKFHLNSIRPNQRNSVYNRPFLHPKNSHENFLSNSPFRWLPLNVLKFRYMFIHIFLYHIPVCVALYLP